MKRNIVLIALVLIGLSGFAQFKSSSKTGKPVNLSQAKASADFYGSIYANDISNNVKLSTDEYNVVKDAYNTYNDDLTAARLKDVSTIEEKRKELSKVRDNKIIDVLKDEKNIEKYKAYIKAKNNNSKK